MPTINIAIDPDVVDSRASAVVQAALARFNSFAAFLAGASTATVTIADEIYTVPNNTTVDAELRGATRKWIGGYFVRNDAATVDHGIVIQNSAGAKYVRQWDNVNIVPEFYRIGLGGLRNDTDAINAAALQLPDGGTIRLQNEKTYWGKQVTINPGTRLEGGTIKRANLAQSTLSVQANAGATSITVADGSAFRIGMTIQIATGLGYQDTATRDSAGFVVNNVVGNVITLSRATLFTMTVGAKVFEYCLQYACSETATVANDADIIAYNVTFDGNNTQNNATHSWTLNNCAIVSGYLQNVVFEKCRFLDMPSECITVSGRAWVNDCIFKDVYGSCVHGSSPTTTEAKGVIIENCQFDNVCISTAAENGHGTFLGVYTQSNATIDIQFLNCRFENTNNGNIASHLSEGLVIQGCKVTNARGIFSEISASVPRQAPRVIGNTFINAGNLVAGGVGNEHLHNGIVIANNYFKNSALRVGSQRHATIANNAFEFDSNYQTRFAAGEIQDLSTNAAVMLTGEVTFTGNRMISSDSNAASLQRGVYIIGYDTPAASLTLTSNTIQGFRTSIEISQNSGGQINPWKNVCSIIANSVTIPDVSGARYGILSYASGTSICENAVHSIVSSGAYGIYVFGSNNNVTSGAIGCKVLNNVVTGCQYWIGSAWFCNVVDGNTYEGIANHTSSPTRQTIGANTELRTVGTDRRTRTIVESLGTVASIADADIPNSTLFVSTSTGKLSWKDASGVVNALY